MIRLYLLIQRKSLRLKRFLKRGKSKKIFNILDKRQLSPAKKLNFVTMLSTTMEH